MFLLLSSALVSSALADPGDGGGGGFTSGEKPGTSSLTGVGGDADTPFDSSGGGGGGGAGVTGGAGGVSPGGAGNGGNGGSHGFIGDGSNLSSGPLSIQASNGGNGGDASNVYSGGGGGGGGGFGVVATNSSSLNVTSGSIAGGSGGTGGASSGRYAGAGGSGGYGLVLNNTSGTHTIDATVSGGNGGNGGDGEYGSSNNGGNAGDAIFLTGHSAPVTVIIEGTVTGGDGGNGGSATDTYSSDGGDGGNGVKGSDVNVVLSGKALVSGGAGGMPFASPSNPSDTGTAGSDGHAIAFTGGRSSLELQATSDGSTATLNGGISHAGSNDILKLGGNNNANFALSGLSGTFSGFGSFQKTGTATWTLTGTTSSTKDWTVSTGVLKLSGGSIAGAASIESGATLQFDQTIDANHSASISGAGGLRKTGSGTLSLTGTNTYLGGTAVFAGTLEANSTAISGNINVLSGATMRFNQMSIGSYSGAISGAGRFEKSGAGTLSLTGTNTYSGGTAVSAGTLEANSTAISGNINVSSGATMRFNQMSIGSYSGAISGAGRFEKSGAGTLSLTGTNTYSGGTAVSAGTLEANSTAISGNINVSSGATMRFNQTSIGSYSGAISGAGRFEKSGAGTLSLTGTNTYSGGTAVSAGTLEANSTAISGNINVSSGATMRFNQTSNGSYSGAISGDGNFEKSGASTLSLTGTNTYSGGTAVSAGTLEANSTAVSGNINVASGAMMRFNQTSNGSYSGAISGDGNFEKSGAGTLTMTGTYSLTGETLLNDGELFFNASDLVSSTKFNLAGGDLTVSGSGTATIRELKVSSTSALKLDGVKLNVTNAVSSTQGVTLTGGGTLNLDQTGNIFGGGVTLSNGTLIVGTDSSRSAASLEANISVASGATLGGHGSITGNVIHNGRLAPGNSIGTTTINGNLSGSGTLEIEVDGDTSSTPSADKLIVNGTVDVSAMTLDLVLSPTSVANWSYGPTGPFTIIENDGSDAVMAPFATVTDNLTFLDASLNYKAGTGNDVALTLLRNDIDMVSTAQTFNQTQVAAAIESLGNTNPVYLAVVTTVSDEAAAQVAFDSLSGEINATLRSVLVSDSHQTRDAALSRLQGRDTSGQNLWGFAIGTWGRYGSSEETYRAESTTGGFLVGYDHAISEPLTLGVLGGYTRTNVSVNQLNSKAVTDSYHLGLYAGGAWNGLTYKGGIATAYNKTGVDRDVRATSTLSQSLSSDQTIYSSQVFAETGYEFHTGGIVIEPFAGLALVHLGSSEFTENGGTAALSADGQGDDTAFFWAGVRAESAFNLFGADVTAKAGLAWQHASLENVSYEQAFSSGGDRFTVNGAPFAQDMALVDAGLGVDLGANTNLAVSYSGQIASKTQNHGLNARLSIQF
ncbi:autotransporter-associated beta strand repeat-containing protein [Labrenzia sp. C1B70]|uniref:autotransporter-associated beta strand repeat-containing protein n=4 Tax=unclassified Labrenzia TaxID=2648686 RepID=UPI0003B8C57D|nr:autotransporter-associated beta strand repeat-containing protein [Labrenzia sp. C1B70]ERS02997.1 hypothetical protein Q675_31635 [Labrenzia sp. C1B70]